MIQNQVKRVNITMKHFGMVSLTVVCDCSVNREMRLYHERANSIRPYNNQQRYG
jgi:hypothetical protein